MFVKIKMFRALNKSYSDNEQLYENLKNNLDSLVGDRGEVIYSGQTTVKSSSFFPKDVMVSYTFDWKEDDPWFSVSVNDSAGVACRAVLYFNKGSIEIFGEPDSETFDFPVDSVITPRNFLDVFNYAVTNYSHERESVLFSFQEYEKVKLSLKYNESLVENYDKLLEDLNQIGFLRGYDYSMSVEDKVRLNNAFYGFRKQLNEQLNKVEEEDNSLESALRSLESTYGMGM